MNVRHPPPGQSPLLMHPKLALLPPMHFPVWQVPLPVQSASEQHGVFAACPPPLAHRPKSLTHVPPPEHAIVEPQPPPPVQLAPAAVPPEQRIGRRSPVR